MCSLSIGFHRFRYETANYWDLLLEILNERKDELYFNLAFLCSLGIMKGLVP
jgi:hypothetical protein